MKRIISIAVIFCLAISLVAFAGEQSQTVVFKDNVVFINGHSIPSVQLENGYAYVWVEDLSHYGFNVTDNIVREPENYYRVFEVNRNKYKKITPRQADTDVHTVTPTQNIVYMDSFTPANVYITDANRTLVQCDELQKFGTFNWDTEKERIDINIGETGQRLPESMKLRDIIGIGTVDEIKYSAIGYKDELNTKSADIEREDLNKLMEVLWNFEYTLEVDKQTDLQAGDTFLNLWTGEKDWERSNNKIKFTVYPDRILYDGYGQRLGTSGIYYTNTAVFYTAKGNGANAIYTAFNELAEKYRDSAVTPDSPYSFWQNKDYLPIGDASEWAKAELMEAASCNLLPYELSQNYQKPISRQDFCTLAYQLLKAIQKSELQDMLYQTKLDIDDVVYSDMPDIPYEIRFLSAIGVIEGMGDGTFMPDEYITREQAAAILTRMAMLLNASYVVPTQVHKFKDESDISSWAYESVTVVYDMGVMQGFEDGCFYPHNDYTTEQSILTMLRLFKVITKV